MTERKQYKYYPPRIQIPVETMFSASGKYALYCLPVDAAQAVQRISNYLKREITYIGEIVDEKRYLGPTEQEIVDIRSTIEKMEVALMSECSIDGVVDQLEAMNATMARQADCICAMRSAVELMSQSGNSLDGYVDAGNATYKNPDQVPITPGAPSTDTEKCQLAQAIYWYFYNHMTESILPAANTTADSLTALVVSLATFGNLAEFVGVPVGIVTGFVASVISWAVDGSIVDYVNWLYASKDDITCIFYNNIPDYKAAGDKMFTWLNEQTEISFGDRIVTKAYFTAEWWTQAVAKDQQENGTWDNYLEAGACDTCPPPTPPGCFSLAPCTPSDWNNPANINCDSGYPRSIGGVQIWQPETPTCPSSGQMTVAWYPYAESPSTTAVLRFGAQRVSDGQLYIEYESPARPVGALAIETFDLSTQVWLQPIKFCMQPISWQGSVVYWCIAEPPDGGPTLP